MNRTRKWKTMSQNLINHTKKTSFNAILFFVLNRNIVSLESRFLIYLSLRSRYWPILIDELKSISTALNCKLLIKHSIGKTCLASKKPVRMSYHKPECPPHAGHSVALLVATNVNTVICIVGFLGFLSVQLSYVESVTTAITTAAAAVTHARSKRRCCCYF